ncbi:MAG: hypothetical protein J5756_01875 [Clostridia bacterium]|nr:hypothetical protein [Clostridia bacterium]
MKKLLAIILILALAIPLLSACAKTPEPTSSSSGSSSEPTDVFVPELRVCGAEAFPQRGEDYVYDYENRTNFSYTFIEEDENYIYLEIESGEEYYLPKSSMYLADHDFVRINKTTGEREIIDTRVDSNFTTIKNGKIYYYKITDDNLNAVFTEYDTETGDTRALKIEGLPNELYIATLEGDDHIDWAIQGIGDAGDGKYRINNRIVDTNKGKTYTLPAGGFFCEYDGKYYYGEYDGDYENYSWTLGPKIFRLMARKISSSNVEEVCRIDFSSETYETYIEYRYAGNGCIFIWDEFFFGRYWIFDIKTGKLILKEAEKQFDGYDPPPESYWTLAYDDEAFYFAECVDEDYNYEVQKVNYDGFKQEAIKGIHIDDYSSLKICNGYIYVYEKNYRQKSETITRYDMDGSNPVEILYNKYEITKILPPEDDEE